MTQLRLRGTTALLEELNSPDPGAEFGLSCPRASMWSVERFGRIAAAIAERARI